MEVDTEAAARAVLAEIEKHGLAFDASEPTQGRRFLNLDRTSGEFLLFVVGATRRRRIVEIGTSNGCSTIWLALALSRCTPGGQLITIERSSEKQRAARDNVQRAGLSAYVEFRLGDATEIARTIEGPIDCVLFDADRVNAHMQLEVLLPKLGPDCLLVTDNAVSHPAELRDYFALFAHRPDFRTLILPIGKGLHIAHRISTPASS